jgi:DNA-binding NtrC family response regulator
MNNRPRILVVEDEVDARQGLATLISGWGYQVDVAADGIQAMERMTVAPPVAVLSDIRMPRMDGLQLLAHIRSNFGNLPVLVLSGQGTKDAVVECLRLRANDYIDKPIRADELRQRLADLLAPSTTTPAEPADEDAADGFIGSSVTIAAVRQLAHQVAPTTASVLITGESGTGKEVLARTLHRLSPRRERAFVAINCAAIPESLMESEIFGHEKGAFTGAQERRAGCFELAENGTLLLDEIGEMPMQTQAKLLRVLEDRKVRRLGSKTELPVNVRVLAATNKDPLKAVATAHLREDLFYRLNVFHLHLPPLRDHLEDLPELCDGIIARLNAVHGRSVERVSPAVMDAFRRYLWPGNVRELRNTLERAVILAQGGQIEMSHLPPDFGTHRLSAEDDARSVRIPVGTTVADAEKALILKTLAQENNNKTRAAEKLGISLKTLQNKLKEYAGAEAATSSAGSAAEG